MDTNTMHIYTRGDRKQKLYQKCNLISVNVEKSIFDTCLPKVMKARKVHNLSYVVRAQDWGGGESNIGKLMNKKTQV